MHLIHINNTRHPLYPAFKSLYAISFPLFEQRTEAQQEEAFLCTNYHLTGYAEQDNLIGFVSYWEFPDYLYIEHLAVNQTLRGKGYGSRILNDFISRTSKIVLLEIDPVTDEVSEARRKFYEKCGFCANPYPHTHPPYRNGYQAHPLIVLTSGRKITSQEYESFNHDLNEVVMKK